MGACLWVVVGRRYLLTLSSVAMLNWVVDFFTSPPLLSKCVLPPPETWCHPPQCIFRPATPDEAAWLRNLDTGICILFLLIVYAIHRVVNRCCHPPYYNAAVALFQDALMIPGAATM
jgi:hypothetical protein